MLAFATFPICPIYHPKMFIIILQKVAMTKLESKNIIEVKERAVILTVKR